MVVVAKATISFDRLFCQRPLEGDLNFTVGRFTAPARCPPHTPLPAPSGHSPAPRR
jgi:hypothetical protein